jgi:uncharacterized protein
MWFIRSLFDGVLMALFASLQSDEERWVTLGETATGNLLVVAHTWVEIGADYSAVRIISARRPTRNEARQYREDLNP